MHARRDADTLVEDLHANTALHRTAECVVSCRGRGSRRELQHEGDTGGLGPSAQNAEDITGLENDGLLLGHTLIVDVGAVCAQVLQLAFTRDPAYTAMPTANANIVDVEFALSIAPDQDCILKYLPR